MKRQTVPFAPGDTETQIVQTVTYDPAEAWVEVTHNGDTLSMSRENWHSLFRLAAQEIGSAMLGVAGVDYPAYGKPVVLDDDITSHHIDAFKYMISNSPAIISAYDFGNRESRQMSYISTSNDGEIWAGSYFDRPEKTLSPSQTLAWHKLREAEAETKQRTRESPQHD